MFCSSCGAQVPDGSSFCSSCGKLFNNPTPAANPSQGMNFDFSNNTASAPAKKVKYEYKVLTQKDKWFSGKFDPANLEKAINAYADQGWKVIGCATADIPGFGQMRQEFITLLEREI